MSKVKPMKNISKNLQSFLEISPMQKGPQSAIFGWCLKPHITNLNHILLTVLQVRVFQFADNLRQSSKPLSHTEVMLKVS